jgi:hypothetical protein
METLILTSRVCASQGDFTNSQRDDHPPPIRAALLGGSKTTVTLLFPQLGHMSEAVGDGPTTLSFVDDSYPSGGATNGAVDGPIRS